MSSIVDYMLIKKATLQEIGSAIRGRKGTTDLIPVTDMASEITSIQGTATVRGKCTILIGGTFSFNYGGIKDVVIYRPTCVAYTDDGEYLTFTAVSAGSGTVTVVSGSTPLLVYDVTVTGGACNHTNFTTEITRVATCVAVGVKTHTCSDCSVTWTEDIPRLDHTWSKVEYDPDKYSDGYGQYCTVCNEQREASCPHENTTDTVTKYATCSYTGVKTYTCTLCGEVVRTETIPKAAHTWENKYFESAGTYGRYCTTCGEEEEDISCLHPSSTMKITTPATCTSSGVRTFYCNACGAEVGSETIPASGHSEGSPVLVNADEMNCQVCAHYEVRCVECNSLLDEYDDDGNFGDHDDSNPLVVSASCTEPGYILCVCGVCLRQETTYTDPALGHDLELVADDSQSSGASLVCTRCDYVEEASYDCDILGHESDDGMYDIDGEAMYKCKRCGEYYSAD